MSDQSNPLTGTDATFKSAPAPLRVSEPCTFWDTWNERLVTAQMRADHPGVLYVCTERDNKHVSFGAVLVITGSHQGHLAGKVYQSILHALRGEGYAQVYYEREVPVLEMALEDAHWALGVVHQTDDLQCEPDLVRAREEALEQIIQMAQPRQSDRVQQAARNAGRAQQVHDRIGRRNPMAAAMANWGVMVQLDHRLNEAVGARTRVSRTRHLILQDLLRLWGVFSEIKIELEAMARWWKNDHQRPDSAEMSALHHRVTRLREKLINTPMAAPYVNMSIMVYLVGQLFQLGQALDPHSEAVTYKRGGDYRAGAYQWVLLLRLHADLAKLLDSVATAQRFESGLEPHEAVMFQRTLERLLSQTDMLRMSATAPSAASRFDAVARSLRLIPRDLSGEEQVEVAYERIKDGLKVYIA